MVAFFGAFDWFSVRLNILCHTVFFPLPLVCERNEKHVNSVAATMATTMTTTMTDDTDVYVPYRKYLNMNTKKSA